MDEKGEYDGNTGRYDSGSPTDRDVAKETVYTDRKTSAANEAAVIYGDEEAARLGYVARGYALNHVVRSFYIQSLTAGQQLEISTHPVYRPRWYYWHRSFPRYR